MTTADWNAVDAGGAAFVLAVNEHGKTVSGRILKDPMGRERYDTAQGEHGSIVRGLFAIAVLLESFSKKRASFWQFRALSFRARVRTVLCAQAL